MCRHSDSTVSEAVGLNLGLLQHLHWQSDAQINRPDLIHSRPDLIHTRPDLIHSRPDLVQKLGQISSVLGQISSKSSARYQPPLGQISSKSLARSHPHSPRSHQKARPDINHHSARSHPHSSRPKSARSHPKTKVVWNGVAKSDLRNWKQSFSKFSCMKEDFLIFSTVQ